MYGVPIEADVEHAEMDLGALVSGEADEADFAFLLGFAHGFGGASGANKERGVVVEAASVDLAEVEAWIEERRRASDAASIQRAPTPDVRKRKTRPVRHQ